MHHRFRLATFLTLLLMTTAPAYAHNPCHPQQESYSGSVADKFSRGFANTTTGWLELPKEIINESRAHHLGYGVTIGLFHGIINTIGRTLIGVVELGTFFVPNDAFIHPRVVWSPFSEQTAYGKQQEH